MANLTKNPPKNKKRASNNSQSANSQEFTFPDLDNEQLYYHALFKAFAKFIEEEKEGYVFTESRLMTKIESARNLYKRYQ